MRGPVLRTSVWTFVFVALWGSAAGAETLSAGANPSVRRVQHVQNAGDADESAAATRTALAYFAAIDSGDFDRAYAFLDRNVTRYTSPTRFRREKMGFKAEAGRVKERVVTRATVYRDPPQVSPGVYVALDFTSSFERMDRHCGYIVLLRQPSGAFAIIREEQNFMSRATAAAIARKHSKAQVDRLWRQLSANCPGYENRSI